MAKLNEVFGGGGLNVEPEPIHKQLTGRGSATSMQCCEPCAFLQLGRRSARVSLRPEQRGHLSGFRKLDESSGCSS